MTVKWIFRFKYIQPRWHLDGGPIKCLREGSPSVDESVDHLPKIRDINYLQHKTCPQELKMSGRLCLAVHEKRRKPVVWVWHMGCMISYFILCAIEYLPGLTMLYRPLKKSIKSPPLPDTAGDRKIVRMQKIQKNSSDGPERVYCHIKAQVGTRKSYITVT